MTTRRRFVGVLAGAMLFGLSRTSEALTASQLRTAASAAITALKNLANPPTPQNDIVKMMAAVQRMQVEMVKIGKSVKTNNERKEVLRDLKEIVIELKEDVSNGPVEVAVGAAVQGLLALALAEGV